MIVLVKEIWYTLLYCWQEKDQSHRVEAALWDCYNEHRRVNGEAKKARQKAARQSRGQAHADLQQGRDT
jgi:hypothetical protein